MPNVTFYDLPTGVGSPTITPVASATAYAGPSDVASLNKARAKAWNIDGNPTFADVCGYLVMIAGQIDAVLVNKGYSVPINTASNPELEGVLGWVNTLGAAWMVETASATAPNVDRAKAAFDAAMSMLESAQFTLDAPVDPQRAGVRAPFLTWHPTGQTFDPSLSNIGGAQGDGISQNNGANNPANPFFSRSMQF